MKLNDYGIRIKEVKRNHIKNHQKCVYCGGIMIKGRGFWVCSECGIEGEVYYEKKDDYLPTETKYQKQHRKEKNPIKNHQIRADLVNVKVLREVREKLKDHLNGKRYPMYVFIDQAILEKIESEEQNA